MGGADGHRIAIVAAHLNIFRICAETSAEELRYGAQVKESSGVTICQGKGLDIAVLYSEAGLDLPKSCILYYISISNEIHSNVGETPGGSEI